MSVDFAVFERKLIIAFRVVTNESEMYAVVKN